MKKQARESQTCFYTRLQELDRIEDIDKKNIREKKKLGVQN